MGELADEVSVEVDELADEVSVEMDEWADEVSVEVDEPLPLATDGTVLTWAWVGGFE